jgi:sulfatase modifying factor 1
LSRAPAIVALAAALGAGAVVARLTAPRDPQDPASVCGVGLPSAPGSGMAFVSGGAFTMGSDSAFPEEGPAHAASVESFWMDRTEVTNEQFATFVAATGYVTLAERGVRTAAALDAPSVAGSAVFAPQSSDGALPGLEGWWRFVPGASWRAPGGPGTSLEARAHHPVVHVAYEDAVAYAEWKGASLPTEEQFEYAARTSARRNPAGAYAANTWQGIFPTRNEARDGYVGAAPVACFEPNALGLHDLIGNVWEWTASPYYPRHDFPARADHPDGYDPEQPAEAVATLKGGSYLCAPDYCMRYRPEARIGQSLGLGTSHIGFRTVRRAE